jgi:antitoxin component YwqK of YwqJK toxin-antitoxin module
MALLKVLPFCFLALALWMPVSSALAEEASPQPIYLEEPDPEPEPREAARKVLEEKYKDGTLRAKRSVVKLSNDRLLNDGSYVEYYADGQKYTEGNYQMGVFEGEWQYWYPNGQLCKKVAFKNGRADGQWEVFDEAGVRMAKKSYQDGQRSGPWISYHLDGETPKFEVTYAEGKPVGKRITYHENGQMRQSVSFKDGLLDGQMLEWDASGKKIAEATLEKGKLKGRVTRLED